jgi:hypothetical protein
MAWTSWNARGTLGLAALVCGCGAHVEIAPEGERPSGEPSSRCEAGVRWEWRIPEQRLLSAFEHGAGHLVVGASGNASSDTVLYAVDGGGATRWAESLGQRHARVVPYAAEVLLGGPGLLIAGTASGPPAPGHSPGDFEVRATEADLTPLWSATLPAEREDTIGALVVDVVSAWVVGATSSFQAGRQIFVTRLDGTGAVGWSRTLGLEHQGGYFAPDEHPFGAYRDASGRLVVGAQRWLGGGDGPPWIFALDADGETAWEHLEPLDYARASEWVFFQTRDGGSVLSGTLPGDFAGGPARVVRLDAAGGVLWAASLDDGSGRQQVTAGGLETAGGEIVLAGYSANSTAARLWRLSATGRVLASRDYPEAPGAFQLLRAMPDGGFLLATTEWGGGSPDGRWHLLRTTAAGDPLWQHEITGIAVAGYTALGEIVVDAAGGILAVGYFSDETVAEGRLVMLEERCGLRR